ncbi:MAG: tRNA (N6-isopentenyl adenosine(37)-C2)-methylthiotransferase MiaB, partial [Firmicutes bacterium]|nr:tRNA (N6-isopentenyl adenosine(37)-C2)-methylthiotransferase MiaB [Bacillota bacterium]
MNEHDSETLAGMLVQMGYEQKYDDKDVDLIVLNTCSIRENADQKFFGTLGMLKKRKLNSPGLTLAVCGCMMQQQHIIDNLKANYPWVDLVFGTHNICEFPKLIEKVML